MSIFSYKLSNPYSITTISDLCSLITASTSQQPVSLYALLTENNQPNAYKLCCQSDISSLQAICKGSSISILYTLSPPSTSLPSSCFHDLSLKSISTADFLIIRTQGIEDGADVKMGETIEKMWTLEYPSEIRNLSLQCVEGAFFSVLGQVNNDKAYVSLKVPFQTGWHSSIWRILTDGKAFGPWLWIEFNVIN